MSNLDEDIMDALEAECLAEDYDVTEGGTTATGGDLPQSATPTAPSEREPLELELVRPIEVITAEIALYKEQAGAAFLEIGRRLIEAKSLLNHGEWLPWLEEKAQFSEATAQRFMRLAKGYENPSPVTDLGASKALILLDLLPSEREEFLSTKHTVNGEEKTAAEMSKRELERAIRERDEMGDQLEKLRQHEKATRIEAKATRQVLEERLTQAESDQAAAQRELEKLRSQATQVAVETVTVIDQEAIDQATQTATRQAEEKLAKKIKTAENAKAKAEAAKTQAEQALSAEKLRQEESERRYQREREETAAQNAALQKKLAIASSSETAIFKVHFEAAVSSINKMSACITTMREGGDTDGADKLAAALTKLLESGLGVVG